METTRPLNVRSFADGIGIVGSAVCAVHCMIAPVLLVAGAALPASFLTDETVHHMLLWAILPAAILALGLGCRQHKDGWVLLLGVLGLVGLSSSAAVSHEVLGEIGERTLTIGSAAVLIVAHVRNFRRCRADDCDHGEPSA